MTDKEIVDKAKDAEKRTGFGELVHNHLSKGVNSAYGIGFIEGMVEYRNSLQKEPVSEELEEAMQHNAPNNIGIDDLLYWRNGFITGAKWQAEQFEKNRLKHCDELTKEQAQIESDFVTKHLKENNRTPTFIDAIEYGMMFMKEQMMKDAVEAKVYNKAYPTEFEIETNTYMQKLKHGDNVKLIIINEE